MTTKSIKVRIFNKSNYQLPEKQTSGASGYDLHANISKPVLLKPNEVNIIPTGIYIEVPAGFEGQVRARSGLSANNGIILVNGIGTIDSDYRGEIKVILMNVSKNDFSLTPGDRIAQLVFVPIVNVDFQIVDSLNSLESSQRNNQGFGHTGL